MEIPSKYLNNPAWVAHHKARLLCRSLTNTRGCKVWQKRKDEEGYSKTNILGQNWSAHRLMFLLAKGPLIHGMEIDHTCRNPSCINPDHLEQVTPRENRRRSSTGHCVGSETHCVHGHPYIGNNIIRDGTRVRCRTCRNKYMREYAAKKVASIPRRRCIRKAPYKNHLQNVDSLAG